MDRKKDKLQETDIFYPKYVFYKTLQLTGIFEIPVDFVIFMENIDFFSALGNSW